MFGLKFKYFTVLDLVYNKSHYVDYRVASYLWYSPTQVLSSERVLPSIQAVHSDSVSGVSPQSVQPVIAASQLSEMLKL